MSQAAAFLCKWKVCAQALKWAQAALKSGGGCVGADASDGEGGDGEAAGGDAVEDEAATTTAGGSSQDLSHARKSVAVFMEHRKDELRRDSKRVFTYMKAKMGMQRNTIDLTLTLTLYEG